MRAKKSLGQHFLHDMSVLSSITRNLDYRPGEQVIEIGPGTGRLTKALVKRVGAAPIVCVERDRDMVGHLAQKLPDVRVVWGDATHFDWASVVDGPAVLASNLPYNASAPIYFDLLLNHRHRFRRMVLMFQKEVAQRLVAGPGSKRFGPPSVLTRLLSDSRLLMTVKPGAFRPPPKVDSAVICVDPLPIPRYGVQEDEVTDFSAFVHAAFRARRKTILNNLKPLCENPGQVCAEAGVEPRARAETLGTELLVRLWRRVIGNPP